MLHNCYCSNTECYPCFCVITPHLLTALPCRPELHRCGGGERRVGRSVGRRGKVCSCCSSESVRCRKLIFTRYIGWGWVVVVVGGWGGMCAMSCCALDLTFDLAIVTLTFKSLCRK